jgi:hypothetical protein
LHNRAVSVLSRRAFLLAGAIHSVWLGWAQETTFVFQNKFWVNLHHFLRAESRRRDLKAQLEPLSSLNESERTAWERGLDGYVEMGKASLIFDDSLVRIDNVLAEAPDTTVLRTNEIEPEIVETLNAAAPVYRAHRWDENRLENAEWIAAHGPAILEHAAAVKKAIGDTFHTVPPIGPILVDFARDIGPNLAYTTEGPPGTGGHTFIAPQKKADPDVALNTIFHEISHTMDNQIYPEF